MKDLVKMTKAVWAVNPSDDEKHLRDQAMKVFSYFHSDTNIEIEPVYVLSSPYRDIPIDLESEWLEEQGQIAKEKLTEILQEAHLDFVKPPVIISKSFRTSTSGMVDLLSDYASGIGADFIITSSHSRMGLKRLHLGSFAETLFLRSALPVLVVGAKTHSEHRIERIFYPTEFGAHSKGTYRMVLSLARRLRAKVTLFHVITPPDEPSEGLNFDPRARPFLYRGKYLLPRQVFELHSAHQQHHAEAWVRWSKHEGVEADYQIEKSFEPLDRLICEAASKRTSDLIMMEAQSGPIRTAIVGSTTRKVARRAVMPLFVFTHKFLESNENELKATGFSTAPEPSYTEREGPRAGR
jgi:nucleotide-binding universal stress UspA family protein